MAGFRNLKVSMLQVWRPFILGSIISYCGLMKLNGSYDDQTRMEKYRPDDFSSLYGSKESIWKKILLLSDFGNWIQILLEDIGTSFRQEKAVKTISKALSTKLAWNSGLTLASLKLLKKFNTRYSRLLLADIIAALDIVEDKTIEEVILSCDERVLIGLARLPDINNNIFGNFCTLKKIEVNDLDQPLESHFRSLLLSLPSQGVDSCTEWFTKSAMIIGASAEAQKTSLPLNFGGDSTLSFAQNFISMPSEQVELYYLKALTRHSMVLSHCQVMVENGILPILATESRQRKNNLRITREVAHIVGNLALDPLTHNAIIKHGFLTVLHSWLYSEDLSLSTHAARALENLDRDFNQDELYEEGIYVLHPDKRNRDQIVADIVFVHGLRGGPLKTWRMEGTNTQLKREHCWPKTWLVNDFPNVRLIVVEYDSSLSTWVAQCPTLPKMQPLAFRSEQIMRKLRKAGVGRRPVIWISHSMGGLLVKQLLLFSQDDTDHRSLTDQTKGLVFYSTPHKGSALASYSSQVKYFLQPTVEVKELSLGSAYLSDLHSSFLKLLDAKNFPCLSIGETIPMNLSWFWNSTLVDESSANFGRGDYFSLNANHINVCKPKSSDDPRYKYIKDFIQRFLVK